MTRHFLGLHAARCGWVPPWAGCGEPLLSAAGWSEDDGAEVLSLLTVPQAGGVTHVGRWRVDAQPTDVVSASFPGAGGCSLLLVATQAGGVARLRLGSGNEWLEEARGAELEPLCAPLFALHAPATCLSFAPATSQLLVGGGDGGVALVALGREGGGTSQLLCPPPSFLPSDHAGGWVGSVAWAARATCVATGAAPGVALLDVRQQPPRADTNPSSLVGGTDGTPLRFARFGPVASSPVAPHFVAAGCPLSSVSCLWDLRKGCGATAPPVAVWDCSPEGVGQNEGRAGGIVGITFDKASAFGASSRGGHSPTPPLLALTSWGESLVLESFGGGGFGGELRANKCAARRLGLREPSGGVCLALEQSCGLRAAATTRAEGLLVLEPGAGSDAGMMQA